MTPPVGFVVLSHSEPALLNRLVNALDRSYGSPPIVVHHDYSQCPLPDGAEHWAARLTFVRPHVATSWAHISVVYAVLLGVKILFETYSPDWFVLLSGTDYPVQPGEKVIEELNDSNVDLYMDLQLIERFPRDARLADNQFSHIGSERLLWRKHAYDRYVSMTWRYPSLTRQFRLTKRRLFVRNETLLSIASPFNSRFRCYAGDHWFTGNARVAHKLIDSQSKYQSLFNYYETRFCPEESIYHTILGNDSELRIIKDNKRYTDWSDGADHPKVLELTHLDAIVSSRSHFARKVSPARSADLLAALDQIVASPPRTNCSPMW
jgi:hypothetical protein